MNRRLYIYAIRIRMNSVMRAVDTYSWRNSFAGNHEEGSVSSRRTASVHSFSSSSCLSSATMLSIHYGFAYWIVATTSLTYAYAAYAYLAIDLKTDRPVVRGIKHEEKIFIRYITLHDCAIVTSCLESFPRRDRVSSKTGFDFIADIKRVSCFG